MDESQQRVEQFKQEVDGMRIRTPSSENERWWLIIGVILMIAGLVAIGAGWWGASGSGDLTDQIPFLISGGVMGLGLVLVGGVLFVRYSLSRYLRYWLIRMIYEQQAQTDRTLEALGRIEQALANPAREEDRT